MLKRAAERDLEIIGEAINRLIKKNSNFENNYFYNRKIQLPFIIYDILKFTF